ncbi:MAG: hypothetical protein JNM94_14340 [Phycisphaerae bacterium]|nr:hypothetical protein [Phycisphaerae bacterium]
MPSTPSIASAGSRGFVDARASEESPTPHARGVGATAEIPRIKRELVLTLTADRTLDRLVDVFKSATGTRLTTSHTVRALLKAVALNLDLIEREARALGSLSLPSNARGAEQGRERFEALLADAMARGMRAEPRR